MSHIKLAYVLSEFSPGDYHRVWMAPEVTFIPKSCHQVTRKSGFRFCWSSSLLLRCDSFGHERLMGSFMQRNQKLCSFFPLPKPFMHFCSKFLIKDIFKIWRTFLFHHAVVPFFIRIHYQYKLATTSWNIQLNFKGTFAIKIASCIAYETVTIL